MELIQELYWDIQPKEITQRQWSLRREVRALIRDGNKIAVIEHYLQKVNKLKGNQ